MKAPASFLDSIDRLHDEAMRATGQSDFGDPSYLDALRVLLRSYDEESRLGPEGREATWDTLRGHLAGRLLSNARFAEHADRLRYSIDRPIVVTGMSRTGTTALHKLLAADPGIDTELAASDIGWMAAPPGTTDDDQVAGVDLSARPF